MSVLKLYVDDFNEIDYDLIAIHTILYDYRLAYFINQKLPVIFSKCHNDIEVSSKVGKGLFSQFFYTDDNEETNWYLIQNKSDIVVSNTDTTNNLFFDKEAGFSSKAVFLPEFKTVDYFLKIENNGTRILTKSIIKQINTIKSVFAVYAVNTSNIKSKNNLIF